MTSTRRFEKTSSLLIPALLTLASLLLSLFHPLLHNHPLDFCEHHDCTACETALHGSATVFLLVYLSVAFICLYFLQHRITRLPGIVSLIIRTARSPPVSFRI